MPKIVMKATAETDTNNTYNHNQLEMKQTSGGSSSSSSSSSSSVKTYSCVKCGTGCSTKGAIVRHFLNRECKIGGGGRGGRSLDVSSLMNSDCRTTEMSNVNMESFDVIVSNHNEHTRKVMIVDKSKKFRSKAAERSEEVVAEGLGDGGGAGDSGSDGADGSRCERCKKTFQCDGDLKTHMLIHSVQVFECKECDRKFRQKSQLHNHTHIDTKNFDWEDSYRNVYPTDVYESESNESETDVYEPDQDEEEEMPAEKVVAKRFECEQCGKRYRFNSHLKNHRFVHNREKQFGCHKCGKKFPYPTSLKRHLLLHGEKPFQCKVCGQKFHYKHHFRNHKLKHKRKRDSD